MPPASVLGLCFFFLLSPLPLLAEDEGDLKNWTDMGVLAERLSSGNTRLADGAVRRIVERSGGWTEGELSLLREVTSSTKPEAARRANAALEQVTEARRLLATFSGISRLLAGQLLDGPYGDPALALRAARILTECDSLDRSTLARLTELADQFHPGLSQDRESEPGNVPVPMNRFGCLYDLDHPDCDINLRALRFLARGPFPDAVPALQRLLTSANDCVRLEALLALIRLGVEPDRRMLKRFEIDIRNGASASAIHIFSSLEDGHDELYEGAWPEADLDCRVALLAPLSRTKSGRQLVLAALRDPQCVVSLAAREVAAGFDREEVRERLTAMLGDVRPRAQENAAWVLGELRIPEAGPTLARMLRASPWPRVREEAARALGKIGDPYHGPILESALLDSQPEIIVVACEALARLGRREARIALRRLYDEGDKETRLAAALALASVGNADDMEALRKDARSSTRPFPLRVLGLLGEASDVQKISEMGQDEIGTRFFREWSEAISLSGDLEAGRAMRIPFHGRMDAGQLRNLALLGEVDAVRVSIGLRETFSSPTSLAALVSTFGTRREDALAKFVVERMEPTRCIPGDPSNLIGTLAAVRFAPEPVDTRTMLHVVRLSQSALLDPWRDPWQEDFRGSASQLVTPTLLESLAVRYEPATADAWMRSFTLKREIRNRADLASAFADAGLALEDGGRTFVRGRIRSGLRVTPRWLAWRCGLDACVLEDGKVRAMPPARAVNWWRTRLEGLLK